MSIICRILSLFVLAAVIAVLSAACHAEVTVLPFVEGSGTCPIVKLRLGPGASGNFLVDTGTSPCLVTEGCAARCSLMVNPLTDDLKQRMASIPSTGYVNTQIAGVGPRNGEVRLIVVPNSYIPRLNVPVDGLIGSEVLSQAPVMFDFDLRKIFLWDGPGVDEHTLTALGMSGADVYKAALYCDNNDIYHVDARINDTLTLRMVLDTGAEAPIIPDAEAKRLHFKPYREGVAIMGFEGVKRGDAYVLDKIAIGPAEMYQVPVFGMPAKTSMASDRVLGRSVLQYFRIFLDPQAAEIRLKSAANAPRQPEATPQASQAANAPRHPEVTPQTPTGPKYMWKPQYKPGQSFTTRYVHTVATDRFKDNKLHKSIDTSHERYTVKSVQPDGTAKFPDELAIGTITVDETPEGEQTTNAAGVGR